MKTKRRTLIVLLVFVLAAGAALALLTHANQKAEQAASEAEDGSIPLLDGTAATLESVSIQYGGETLTLRPSDDGWTLTEDPAYHLDDSACSTIRTALAGTKAKRQLEAQPGEDYGFDAPQLVVNVSAAGESTTLTVGAENPVTGDVYVLYRGRGQVPLHGADEGGALWGVQPGGHHSLGHRGCALHPPKRRDDQAAICIPAHGGRQHHLSDRLAAHRRAGRRTGHRQDGRSAGRTGQLCHRAGHCRRPFRLRLRRPAGDSRGDDS